MNIPAKQQKNIQSGLVPICTAILVPSTTNTAGTHRHVLRASDSLEHSGMMSHWGENPTGGEGVAAVVKQLAQRRTAVGASGLLPVNGVQWLVDKKAHGTKQVRPERSLEQETFRKRSLTQHSHTHTVFSSTRMQRLPLLVAEFVNWLGNSLSVCFFL